MRLVVRFFPAARPASLLHTAAREMADAVVPILKMFESGVLIMDEVDVLLHPLRSELNFPIGDKLPIDMAGLRCAPRIFCICSRAHTRYIQCFE